MTERVQDQARDQVQDKVQDKVQDQIQEEPIMNYLNVGIFMDVNSVHMESSSENEHKRNMQQVPVQHERMFAHVDKIKEDVDKIVMAVSGDDSTIESSYINSGVQLIPPYHVENNSVQSCARLHEQLHGHSYTQLCVHIDVTFVSMSESIYVKNNTVIGGARKVSREYMIYFKNNKSTLNKITQICQEVNSALCRSKHLHSSCLGGLKPTAVLVQHFSDSRYITDSCYS